MLLIMMDYSSSAYVCTLHLISHQHTPPMTAIPNGSISPPRHVIDETHTPVIFSALVLWGLCHRPFCAPTSPLRHLSLHHSARGGVGQFISLLSWHFQLALGPTHTTFLHFRHSADVAIRSQVSRKVSKQVEKPHMDS